MEDAEEFQYIALSRDFSDKTLKELDRRTLS